jgi:hypothetical protein
MEASVQFYAPAALSREWSVRYPYDRTGPDAVEKLSLPGIETPISRLFGS